MGKFISYFTAVCLFLSFSLTAQAQEEASAASLYNEAVENLKAKKYEEALSLLEQSLEIADPEADAKVIQLAQSNGSRAAYMVGSKYRKSKDYEKALEAYDKGIEFNPDFYANYRGRAQALEGNGDVTESVKAYVKASEVAKASGETEKADQYMSKAENIVALAYGDKAWDNVIEYGQSFLEIAETPDAHYYLAYGLKEKGKNQDALAHADKAIETATDSDMGKYYMVKAEIHEAMNQDSEALETYKKITSGKYAERAKYKVNELSGGR